MDRSDLRLYDVEEGARERPPAGLGGRGFWDPPSRDDRLERELRTRFGWSARETNLRQPGGDSFPSRLPPGETTVKLHRFLSGG